MAHLSTEPRPHLIHAQHNSNIKHRYLTGVHTPTSSIFPFHQRQLRERESRDRNKTMSVASPSIPCIKISNPSSPSSSTCSSSSSSSSSTFRFSATKPSIVTIRSSQTEGPLRRPVASPPPLKPVPPSPPSPPSSSPPPPPKPASVMVEDKSVIALEFQRQKAKELQEYFKQKKLEEADQGPFFGFIGKNEISNGRWAMFGFAVGMLTEYATGSDFVDQVKILLSNFGIVDLE